jgi:ABC-type phosphate transport system substrate-binding protein
MHTATRHRLPLLPLLLGMWVAVAQPARADVVVIVADNSPLKSLSSRQLTAIFLGKISTLPDGTHVVPVDLTEEAPARKAFYSTLIGKSANQIRAYWSRLIFSGRAQPPRSFANEEVLKKTIAQHPDWIGYIDRVALDPSVRQVILAD